MADDDISDSGEESEVDEPGPGASAGTIPDNSIQVSARASLVANDDQDIRQQVVNRKRSSHVIDDSAASSVSIKRGVMYSLFKTPMILGVVVIILIIASCSLGNYFATQCEHE